MFTFLRFLRVRKKGSVQIRSYLQMADHGRLKWEKMAANLVSPKHPKHFVTPLALKPWTRCQHKTLEGSEGNMLTWHGGDASLQIVFVY